MSTEPELRAVRALPNSPFVLLLRRRRWRVRRRALRWGARPARVRRRRTVAADQTGSFRTAASAARGHLPRLPLSSSRAPRLGRPPGVASRWLRQPRPSLETRHPSQGFGACEKDGRRAGQAGDTRPTGVPRQTQFAAGYSLTVKRGRFKLARALFSTSRVTAMPQLPPGPITCIQVCSPSVLLKQYVVSSGRASAIALRNEPSISWPSGRNSASSGEPAAGAFLPPGLQPPARQDRPSPPVHVREPSQVSGLSPGTRAPRRYRNRPWQRRPPRPHIRTSPSRMGNLGGGE